MVGQGCLPNKSTFGDFTIIDGDWYSADHDCTITPRPTTGHWSCVVHGRMLDPIFELPIDCMEWVIVHLTVNEAMIDTVLEDEAWS